jgi:hypothetical protein
MLGEPVLRIGIALQGGLPQTGEPCLGSTAARQATLQPGAAFSQQPHQVRRNRAGTGIQE